MQLFLRSVGCKAGWSAAARGKLEKKQIQIGQRESGIIPERLDFRGIVCLIFIIFLLELTCAQLTCRANQAKQTKRLHFGRIPPGLNQSGVCFGRSSVIFQQIQALLAIIIALSLCLVPRSELESVKPTTSRYCQRKAVASLQLEDANRSLKIESGSNLNAAVQLRCPIFTSGCHNKRLKQQLQCKSLTCLSHQSSLSNSFSIYIPLSSARKLLLHLFISRFLMQLLQTAELVSLGQLPEKRELSWSVLL